MMIAKTGQDRCVSFLCEYANCANAGTLGFIVKSSLNVFRKKSCPTVLCLQKQKH